MGLWRNVLIMFVANVLALVFRQDGTSGETSASGTGGMGFKSRSDQIYTLPTTHYRCNVEVWALTQLRRWASLTRDTRKDIKRV